MASTLNKKLILCFSSSESTRTVILFLLLSLVSLKSIAQSSHVPLMPAPPQLAASSYLLIDAETGKVIVEYQADTQLPPASLTKIMTGYIVSSELSKGNIQSNDKVPISVKAWKMGGSRMFVREGTEVSVEDLLRGIIIQSGNDASVALAEFIAGDETAFSDMMNQQAILLGMRHTHFKNATGWPADGHLTTARDLAVLAKSLIETFPSHYSLYAEKEFVYNNITQSNRNGLLWRDQNVDGIKTGHTDEAGYCLVSSAKRDDMRLIAVVMGAKSSRAREQESQKLLAYGFRYFKTHTLYQAGEEITTTRVWAGQAKSVPLVLSEPLVVTIPRDQRESLDAVLEIDKQIVAPVNQSAVYGSLILKLHGEILEQRDLVAATTVESAGFFAKLWDQCILFVRGILGLSS